MRRAAILIALAALTAGAGVGPALATALSVIGPEGTYGIWSNPKGSVHVEVRPCGDAACGFVVWANAKAQADARKGGTENLIGLQIFRDFERESDGSWKGKVFVPDLNRTFSGGAIPIDARTLRTRGCIFAGLGCKSQIWTRVDRP